MAMIETYRKTVAETDCDRLGHMNIASYATAVSEGTFSLFDAIGWTEAGSGLGIDLVGHKMIYTFRQEIWPSETIALMSGVASTDERDVTIKHILSKSGENIVCMWCDVTGVFIDRRSRSRVRVPSTFVKLAYRVIGSSCAGVRR